MRHPATIALFQLIVEGCQVQQGVSKSPTQFTTLKPKLNYSQDQALPDLRRGVGGMGGALLNPAAVPKETGAGFRSLHRRCVPCVRRTAATLVRSSTNVGDQAESLGTPKISSSKFDECLRRNGQNELSPRCHRGGGRQPPSH